MKLNDAIVNSLPAPDSTAAKLYADDSIPHFAVRVSKAGGKSFVLTLGTERRASPSAATQSSRLPKLARRRAKSWPSASWVWSTNRSRPSAP